ncbi:hypothetical protein C8R46DRAFT_1351268 [Mycena filopes]|nr:hypothetical protein C8R46DRAFT_1351268 [Mycena filopes]
MNTVQFTSPLPPIYTLPNELITELMRLEAGHTPHELPLLPGEEPHRAVALSQVCSHWRTVALSTAFWNRVALQLDSATYAAALEWLKVLFARAAALNNLVIELSAPEDTSPSISRLAFVDIVQPYSSLIVSLNLCLDIDVIHELVCLPAGTFPHLHTLQLIALHPHRARRECKSLVFGGEPDEEDDLNITKMSDLAPLLSSFGFDQQFTPKLDAFQPCVCELYPTNIGLDLARLTSLTIGVTLVWWHVHELLRHCVCLEVCNLDVYSGEDDDASKVTEEEKGLFELPAPRSLVLHLESVILNPFFLPLRCPALTELDLTDELGHNHQALMECLQGSRNRLSSLRLSGIEPLTDGNLTELFTLQPAVTRLDLSECTGSFWKALKCADPLLLPGLEEFRSDNVTTHDVQGVMDFVDARCGAAGSPLKTVLLSVPDGGDICPGPEQLLTLKEAINRWKEMGIDVELDGNDEELDGSDEDE